MKENFHKRLILNLIGLGILGLYSGCSSIEQIVISNAANTPAIIRYTLPITPLGIGMFETSPFAYQLTSKGSINWEKTININDSDTSPNAIIVQIPPRSALVIGALMNDNYENHKQDIRQDQMNLERLTINYNNQSIEITPQNFKVYFKKKEGTIVLELQPTSL